MSKKIYVGNLSFQTTETEITQAFSGFGPVESVSIITDRDTGRSKGFAFVQMAEGADVEGRLGQGRCLMSNIRWFCSHRKAATPTH